MKVKTSIGRSKSSKLPALRISAPSAKHRHRKFNMANEDHMDQGSAVSPQARQKAERGGTQARKAAEDLGSAAGEIANKYLGRAEEVWDDSLDRVRTFQDDSKQYILENPTKAVFTALGVGLVLGFIFRR
jgi:ElaB/YqjD/DUF883 family membrane-anchored ribosome-binding protein